VNSVNLRLCVCCRGEPESVQFASASISRVQYRMLNFLGAPREHGRSAAHKFCTFRCGNRSASSILDVDFRDRSDKFASTFILAVPRSASVGGGRGDIRALLHTFDSSNFEQQFVKHFQRNVSFRGVISLLLSCTTASRDYCGSFNP